MKIIRIDTNGYFAEDVILHDGEKIPADCIETPIPTDVKGFYKPRWTGTEWVEDMSQGEIDALNTPTIERQTEALKIQLSETDYKIIKCSEYQLAGLELPYDIAALHTDRQALRDRINELELALS